MTEFDHTRQTLIERIRDQYNEPAWEEFARIYESYIYAIIRRMGISAEDSKDIHQDIMLNIWKKLPEYRKKPDTRFRGWLSTITSNSVKYFLRSKANLNKKHDNFGLDQNDETEASALEKIANEEWEIFLTNKALENVESAFSGKGIDVFKKSLEGKSIPDIAKEMDIEESSVYQLRARVKRSLIKEVNRLREVLD